MANTENNAITHVTGYVCHKVLKIHPCEMCKQQLINTYSLPSGTAHIFLDAKANETNSGSTYTTQKIIDQISDNENTFLHRMKINCREF